MLDRVVAPEGEDASRSPIPLPVAFGGYVLAFFTGAALSIPVLAGTEPGDESSITLLFATAVIGWAAFLLMLWYLSRFAGTGRFARDYAVRFRPIDLIGVPIGVLMQLAVVPFAYWPLRSIWPDTFSLDDVADYAEDLVDRTAGFEYVLLILMVVALAPVVEELVYRALLHRSIARNVPAPLAVLASATFFMLIHFRPVEYPGLLLIGIVLGICVAATGRIGMAVATHVAFNAMGLIVAAA